MKRVTNPWFLIGLIMLLTGGTFLVMLHGTFIPERQELTPRERFGTGLKFGVNASTTASSSFALVEHKQWSDEALGFLFQYPENFTVTKKGSTVELKKGETHIVAGVACIPRPVEVSDLAWENNFSSPDFAQAIDPAAGSVLQAFDKNDATLFAFESGSGRARFKGIACVGGTNRKGNQAGRCFQASTNEIAPDGPAYDDLRNYFLGDFLQSVGFLEGFDNVVSCPGLGD